MTTGGACASARRCWAAWCSGLGLFIAIETSLLEVAPSNAAIGPRLFPSLVAVGLLAVGVAVLWQAFFGHIAHERGFELDWRAVALVSAGLLLQMFLVESLGWIIATTLLFVATSLAFAERRLVIDRADRPGAHRPDLRGLQLRPGPDPAHRHGHRKLLPATDEEAE